MQINRLPIIVWFRQDLRLRDNPALYYAVRTQRPIIPLYILSETNHHSWKLGKSSAWWLHYSLMSLKSQIKLVIKKGSPLSIIQKLFQETGAEEIVFNSTYDPFTDEEEILKRFPSQVFHGSVLFPCGSILNQEGKPFKVFTPFYNACLKESVSPPLPLPKKIDLFKGSLKSLEVDELNLLSRSEDFTEYEALWQPGEEGALKKLTSFVKTKVDRYQKDRDFPVLEGSSLLSPHLHFGEISPKQVWKAAEGKTDFLRQIVWREFAIHLLKAYPHLPNTPFDAKFKNFPWGKNTRLLEAWLKGQTGYPIVDAGMRQLRRIGWMHNRLRMIVGSFLVKDLNISWTDGSQWFWKYLIDADLANNTFGWQWVSGCGLDAAPYFRIFNPVLQSEKFDPKGEFIKTFVPELSALDKKWIHQPWKAPADVLLTANVVLGQDYPWPVVDHNQARKDALSRLKHIS